MGITYTNKVHHAYIQTIKYPAPHPQNRQTPAHTHSVAPTCCSATHWDHLDTTLNRLSTMLHGLLSFNPGLRDRGAGINNNHLLEVDYVFKK